MRDSPQARAISRTLGTSRSVAARTADAGTNAMGDRLAVRSEHLELVTLGHVDTRRIVLDDHSDVAWATARARRAR